MQDRVSLWRLGGCNHCKLLIVRLRPAGEDPRERGREAGGGGGRCKFSAKSGRIGWRSEIICLQCFSTLESSLEQSALCPREYPSLHGFPREVSSWMTQRGGWPIFGSSACQTQCHRSQCHTRVEDKRPNSADARNALTNDLAHNVRWLVVCMLFLLWQCSVEWIPLYFDSVDMCWTLFF